MVQPTTPMDRTRNRRPIHQVPSQRITSSPQSARTVSHRYPSTHGRTSRTTRHSRGCRCMGTSVLRTLPRNQPQPRWKDRTRIQRCPRCTRTARHSNQHTQGNDTQAQPPPSCRSGRTHCHSTRQSCPAPRHRARPTTPSQVRQTHTRSQ